MTKLNQSSVTAKTLARGDSPCIGVCTIDPHRTCVGCGRTLEVIGQWSTMSVQQRIAANKNLPKRIIDRLCSEEPAEVKPNGETQSGKE